jgi:beta-galactosidase
MTILYGADYNPEQWPSEVWKDDVRLMRLANINIVSLYIFAWAMLEPKPEKYSFEQLDELMDLLGDNGISVNLATATASPPTWMSRLYPDMLPVLANGTRMSHGSRQAYCPNSPDYRRKCAQLVKRLAERYKDHKALRMWHVNNEYGCHVSECYCDYCAEEFREWLGGRYKNLETLNDAWSTNFWSQRYGSWDDILPPRMTPTQNNPSQVLDYKRFMNDSLLTCYRIEKDILAKITPKIPATTNFMASFKPLNYFSWAPYLDVVAVDVYPPLWSPPSVTAITFDTMRSLKHAPFLVMEQSPSQVNWMDQNPHPRPGVVRLQSLQAVSRGADGIMYFQFRQSRGGAEKFHSAVVSHEGSENTRIFKQIKEIGEDLKKLSFVTGWECKSEVAIIIDWENWWSVEYRPGPSDQLWYSEQVMLWHRALHGLNVPLDFVLPESDLSSYRVVFAPLLYMVRSEGAKNLETYVRQGGTLVVTFFSGIVDEHDRVTLGGYPGLLRKLLGIYVEEFDPFIWGTSDEIKIEEEPLKGTYPCKIWAEVVHLETAEAIGTFASDYYGDKPALTCNSFGKGKAWYLATQSEELASQLTTMLCGKYGGVDGMNNGKVEISTRQKDGKKAYFLLNHNDWVEYVKLPEGKFREIISGKSVSGEIEVKAKDVVVLVNEEHHSRI